MGFIISISAGIGLAVIQESLDHGIKTIEELNSITGNKVLVSISMIETDEEIRKRRIKRLVWVIVLTGVFLLILAIVNHWFMPIEEIWHISLRRFKME